MSSYSSFVVKIWNDPSSLTLRGQIQHVGTEDSARFVDIEKMVQFIKAHLDADIDEDALPGARKAGEDG
jgi:hypothetical protein